MSDRNDLTRWNRASLNRFRYIDGNAVEYLELLRQQLVKRFVAENAQADTEAESSWLKPAEEVPPIEAELDNETLVQRQERLGRRQERILDMYHQDRRDWAWEISRTFARACHILTEHVNAYANEKYLGTATQWEHVRRMVEMLDYHPAPPASAFTRLALEAKENKIGLLATGFKVQHTPETGGQKIIFETLEDIVIDSALNELRPAGWDKSDDPAVDLPGGDSSSGERRFSPIAEGEVINLQGVGGTWSDQLNGLSKPETFKIKDFLDLDPANPEPVIDPMGKRSRFRKIVTPVVDISEVRLREFKAKAGAICNFNPGTGWSDITNWLLPRIAAEKPELLVEETGKSITEVQALQLEIELIGGYLDHEVYRAAPFRDLIAPLGSQAEVPQSVATDWRAKTKPRVAAGQVAMIRDESKNRAEAATVGNVDDEGKIDLLLDQVDHSWSSWPKSDIALHVSPRLKRKCWLNNAAVDVIRTVEPHGFTKDMFIGWQDGSKWKHAKVKQADKRSIRLELDGTLPEPATELVVAGTFDGDKMPADFDAIALINDAGDDKKPQVTPVTPELKEPDRPDELPDPVFEIKKVFPIDKSTGGGGGGGGGLLPPASLPKIGSFLFPSPMLPMDLVKAAVELLLSLGVMQIPSTGDFVIKGLPFGGMLEGADTLTKAAAQMIEMLDELNRSAKWIGGRLHELLDLPGADPENPIPIPIYFELNCEDGQLPIWLGSVEIVNAAGVVQDLVNDGLKCLDGRVVNSSDEALGYQPISSSAGEGELVQFKLTEWDESNWDPTKPDLENKKINMQKLLEDAANDASVLFKQIHKNYPDEAGNQVEISGPLLAVPSKPIVKAVVDAVEPVYMFDGKPEELVEEDWVVGRFDDGLRGLQIRSITEFSEEDETQNFSVSFSNLNGNEGELQQVYADFRGSLFAEGASLNGTEIDSDEIELEAVPDSLEAGKDVLLTADNKEPVVAKIESIDGNNIRTNPSAEGFSKGELRILANVVLTGHGESKPAKILGSGDAAKSNQEFTLEIDDISFPPDTTKTSGVAAAIEVEVAGRIWQQVSTLKDSTSGDHHYSIRMTEAGYVKVLFGDGEYGRRLPTGKNNIRVKFRVGSGLAGNVPAGGLEKAVNPSPLIKSITQPLRAEGGGDMEDVASLRENAPPTLLALERAVSVSDFAHLAAAQSSVWQARAYSEILYENKLENLRVVIVPAGGATSTEVEDEIEKFLQRHALPGVKVHVDDCVKERFSLAITLRINTEQFVAEDVKTAVTKAVKSHFTLQNRKLGGHLYLSEVYKVVEAVLGVENSICVLNNDDSLQLVRAASDSVIVYLDTDADSVLQVTHEEYQP